MAAGSELEVSRRQISMMKPRMRPMPAEDTVEVVARGEAGLVVVAASRIFGVPGVEAFER